MCIYFIYFHTHPRLQDQGEVGSRVVLDQSTEEFILLPEAEANALEAYSKHAQEVKPHVLRSDILQI